jgi:hypothetical protein
VRRVPPSRTMAAGSVMASCPLHILLYVLATVVVTAAAEVPAQKTPPPAYIVTADEEYWAKRPRRPARTAVRPT